MRKVFFSFDWADFWRAYQVRHSWIAKGSYKAAGFMDKAEIEKIKKPNDDEIKQWIKEQLAGTSVTCVLIGCKTHRSKWVKYEIEQSIKKKNGVLGVRIHNLKAHEGMSSDADEAAPLPAQNILTLMNLDPSQYAYKTYDWEDDNGYDNLGKWVEEAARQAGR